MFVKKLIEQLIIQKKDLGMTNEVIAQRSGVSEPTVVRILSGKHPSAHFDHVLAISEVLGVRVGIERRKNPEHMKLAQAKKKAADIMKLVRGNSALEATETSHEAYRRMESKTVSELMAGPKRMLWA